MPQRTKTTPLDRQLMTEVAIVQRVLTHYRVPFFNLLRDRLASTGTRLRLLVGDPHPGEAVKRDIGELPWAEHVASRYLGAGGREFVWQPIARRVRTSDLVVVEQASRLLVNYALLARRAFGGPRVAFWGHGANLDRERASRTGEWVKQRIAGRPDWWFCYTEGTSRLVNQLGVPRDRTTVVQNATDTAALRSLAEALGQTDMAEIRRELGVGDGPIAVALGSIYDRKRPGFLVETAEHIRGRVPGFELVVIGDGPERPIIDAAASRYSWIHAVGARTGQDMAALASLGCLVLNPGLVGLAVLDAFALGLPMVTCDLPYHSPEIEYLVDDRNGLILRSGATPVEFADTVTALLRDPARMERLQEGAQYSATRYTLEEMVDRFTHGVRYALELQR